MTVTTKQVDSYLYTTTTRVVNNFTLRTSSRTTV